MLQPALRARRTAVYEMMLENQGNTQASCRLHLLDPTGRVDGDFDPPAVGVEPGASSLIRLKVHANRLQWERRSRTVQFTIDADQPGCPTASAPVTFVQASMVPERLFSRLLALLVTAAALGGLWFGMVKPAIRNAADDAVAEQLPAAISSTSVVAAPVISNDSVPATTSVPQAVNEGTLFSKLLAPAAPAGQTASVTVDVPAGSTFQLTDFALQNPDKDAGLAVLLNGSTEIYKLSLDDVIWRQTGLVGVADRGTRGHVTRVPGQLQRSKRCLRYLHDLDAGIGADGHRQLGRRCTDAGGDVGRRRPFRCQRSRYAASSNASRSRAITHVGAVARTSCSSR